MPEVPCTVFEDFSVHVKPVGIFTERSQVKSPQRATRGDPVWRTGSDVPEKRKSVT
jgi:hypothetical protein